MSSAHDDPPELAQWPSTRMIPATRSGWVMAMRAATTAP